METIRKDPILCEYCKKTFSTTSSRNKHRRALHPESLTGNEHTTTNKKHILCPLCSQDTRTPFTSYDILTDHFSGCHSLSVIEENLSFQHTQHFKDWKLSEKIEANYSSARSLKSSDCKISYFFCNRSNGQGYTSNCRKRKEKIGGSIKIDGVCPSRIIAYFKKSGEINVKYVKTHVGHDCESRGQSIKQKLLAAVPKEAPEDSIKEFQKKEIAEFVAEQYQEESTEEMQRDEESVRRANLEWFKARMNNMDLNEFMKKMVEIKKIIGPEQEEKEK